MESANALATGSLVPLSVQQVLDCGFKYGAQSCNGGDVNRAFMYSAEYGLCDDASYPFFEANYRCCGDSGCNVGVPGQEGLGMQGHCDVPPGSESDLISALARQPVAVGLRLGNVWAFLQSYKPGQVYAGNACGTGLLNEAALLVGYGQTTGGKKFWKVRLSHGTSVGDGGYALLARGADTGPLGQCGILAAPSYPVVIKPATPYPKPVKRRHYGIPPCLSSETALKIEWANTTVCTTACSQDSDCPTLKHSDDDTENGQCAISDAKSGKRFCAIQCELDCDCPWGESCVSGRAWQPSDDCGGCAAGSTCCRDPGAAGRGGGACYKVSDCSAIHEQDVPFPVCMHVPLGSARD